jgi:flagellin-like protein
LRSQISKIKKSDRALSPVISVLLIIAITVAASLVAYLWVNNYLGFTTSRAGKAIQIQSMARDPLSGNLIVYLQNVGQGSVTLNPVSSVFINGQLEPSDIAPSTLPEGATSTITTTHQITTNNPITVKVLTTEGIFAQSSTTSDFFALLTEAPTQSQYQILFAKGTGGSASTPSDKHFYSAGARIPVFAFADSGYTFSKWTADTNQIEFDNPISSSTWATINGAGTIIAAFTHTKYIVTFYLGSGGATLNPSGTQTYSLNTRVPIITSAANGYTFSTWTTTGQIALDNPNSASTTATINGAGTVDASFIQNLFSVEFTTNGGGTSTTDPTGTHTYHPGQTATITAVSAPGYTFSVWTTTGSIAIAQPNAATATATINSPGQITANFNTQTKVTPTLSCTPNTNILAQGETVTSTGTLIYTNQGILSKIITISYSLPGQAPTSHTQTTGALGEYTDSFKPNKAGQWTIQATFAGDSNYNPTSSTAKTVTVDLPTPVTINFQTNNMDADTGSAAIITVDSINFTYDEIQTLSFSWTPGTTHIITASSPVSTYSENRQYVWTSWNATSFGNSTMSTYTYIVSNVSETVAVNFLPQAQIIFAYYDQYDTYAETDPTVTYYAAGELAKVNATKYGSETVWVDVDSTYIYPIYLPALQNNLQWQTPAPSDVIQPTNDWIQPFYYGQYKVTLSYTIVGVGGGYPEPPRFTAYQLGIPQDLTITTTPTVYWIDDFYYSITTNLQSGTGNLDETWQLAQADYGLVNELQPVATFTYYHQFALTVTTNPANLSANFQVTYTQFGIQYISEPQTTIWSEWVDAQTTAKIINPQAKIGALSFLSANPSQIIAMNQSQQITLNYG